MRFTGRYLRRALVTAAAVLSVGLLAAPPANATSTADQLSMMNHELSDVNFFWTMYNNRAVAPYNQFDWSTDLCSDSPDRPLGFDFTRACRRHDFGYRNFKRLGAFDETVRLRIDNAFDSDMKASCATYNVFVRPACYGAAAIYYEAVREFGS